MAIPVGRGSFRRFSTITDAEGSIFECGYITISVGIWESVKTE